MMNYKKIIACLCSLCIFGCSIPYINDYTSHLQTSAEAVDEFDIIFTKKGQYTQISIQSDGTSDISWYSDNTNVVTIDESCTVTAVGEGTANIYIVSANQIKTITVFVKFEEDDDKTDIILNNLVLSNEHPSATASLSNVDASEAVWSSTDSTVATVDQNGVITAVGSGVCNIIATLNGINYIINVTSTYTKENVVYSLGTITLSNDKIGAHLVLNGIESEANIVWSSTNENVAVVDQNGVIRAAGTGECQIIAVVSGGSLSEEVKYVADIKSEFDPSLPIYEIELSNSVPSRIITLTGVSNDTTITWSSSNTSVAKVDQNGTVTANGKGVCQVTASINGVNYIINVVSDYSDVGFSSQSVEIIGIGSKTQLKLENSDQPVWTSTNINVATVDSNGIVTAVGEGEAVILAQTDGKVHRITVIVKTGVLYGDADLDGKTGISDVVKVMMYASNKESNPLSDEALNNCDVYNRGDGVFTSDALSIQKKLAQAIEALPESYLNA